MHGDWAELSISLIDVEPDCEASNLTTRAKGNPGGASQGQGDFPFARKPSWEVHANESVVGSDLR